MIEKASQSSDRGAVLEKIPDAAKRCGVSLSTFYRLCNAGEIGPIVKVGIRGSAVPSCSVDAWVARRIAEARARLPSCDAHGQRP